MTEEERLALPYRPNVGLMVVNPVGHVFAGQRLDHAGNAWQMPQGGIDEGEEPLVAAMRELGEETGISEDLVDLLAETSEWLHYDFPVELAAQLWRGGYRGQKQRWYLFRYLGNDAQINIATEEPEFSVWRWMEPAEVIKEIVPFKRDIYAQVFRAFESNLKTFSV